LICIALIHLAGAQPVQPTMINVAASKLPQFPPVLPADAFSPG
jgi:hypothetical protein